MPQRQSPSPDPPHTNPLGAFGGSILAPSALDAAPNEISGSAPGGTHQRGMDIVTSLVTLVRISPKSASTAKISQHILPQTLQRQWWDVACY
jgi:hypothetical protein